MTPTRVVAVLGTGTEVGKTWVTVRLVSALAQRALHVVARKPAQSFDAHEARAGLTDRDLLAAASGEPPEVVCPDHRCYPRAMAPPMAADSLGLAPIVGLDLVDETVWPTDAAFALIETAGGAASPIAHDATSAELAAAFEPDLLLLVGDAGLGTIHAVTTTLPLLTARPTVVFLNRFDPDDELHRRNRTWLDDRAVPCLVAVDDLVERLVKLIS